MENQQTNMPNTSPKKTILLVEDEAFLSSLLALKLEQQGFNVEKAMDGEEAFELLKTIRPDLILLDLILPKRNGFEFLELLRNDPNFSKTPVIITSNLGQDTDIERGKNFGVIEYIVKNRLSIDELIDKVSSEVKKLA
ncbi:MAG: response regulator [Candidatus Pacebacteria bacterium]|nr:response regulator [Candidatus Paceibacterota bacterium]